VRGFALIAAILGQNSGLLIEVFTFRTPDFVMITRRILENASIQVS
jgi:hypothetical protein